MIRSYKYRIYPSTTQHEALGNIFEFCRFLYNNALEERISYYKRSGKSLTYNQQCKELPEIKTIFTEAKSIYAQTLQSTLRQLDSSYQNFFRGVNRKSNKVGFPRFKSKDRFRSICFPQCDFISGQRGVTLLSDNKIKVHNIPGEIKMIQHRPFQGRCKTVKIVKYPSGKYYIILSCADVPSERRAPTGKEVGIDLGLVSFVTTDQGATLLHPKPYKTAKEKLAYLQRKRAASQPTSQNNKKLKIRIAKQHEKIVNIRNDFQHKAAKRLVDTYDKIYIEKLNISKMLESKGFAVNKSNISDVSWGSFVAIIKYKAENAGVLVTEVNPANTSRTCSQCGNIKKELTLKDRTYHCEACGFTMDRDQNAAINIRRAGTALIGAAQVSSIEVAEIKQ